MWIFGLPKYNADSDPQENSFKVEPFNSQQNESGPSIPPAAAVMERTVLGIAVTLNSSDNAFFFRTNERRTFVETRLSQKHPDYKEEKPPWILKT